MAVSKTHPAARIREAHAAGQRDFGENYVQEAIAKMDALADLDLEWHFVGPIQSNKTRPIAERFDWVHSVDREKIAARLSAQRPASRGPLNVCIQVNVSGEASKSGCAPEEALPLARAVAAMPHLRLRGLMAVPEPTDDPAIQRARFARLAALRDAIAADGVPLDTLSMGMSDDLEAAIAAGSTMVRIGTAIFGPRDYEAAGRDDGVSQDHPAGQAPSRGLGTLRPLAPDPASMQITFIGGGNMAAALAGGLAARGFDPADIKVVELLPEARARLTSTLGVKAVASPAEAAPFGDLVVLAVKPQQMCEACTALAPHLGDTPVLSIAAGVRTDAMSRWLGGNARLLRCMPNTPALIGMGIAALYAGPGVTQAGRDVAQTVLEAVGKVVWVDDEAQLDPVTAVSGSGPAYVFYFIEALQEASRTLGLSDEVGRQLAIETFRGAAELAARSPETAATLRERVTSKGGTTEAALASMGRDAVKEAIVRAVQAASARGRELGDLLGKD